jgi:DNA polymerase III subunit beta
MMKVNCSRSALENALGIIAGVVSSRTPREALKCTQLVAKKDQITLAGTDLEVSVRCAIPQVEVEREGKVLLPAAKLSQIVHELSDEVLGIEANEDGAHVRGHGSHFQIYGQDPEEFPPIPEFDGKGDVTLSAKVVHRLIERTAFAAARENTRYAISGVLWERQGKKLQLVATDGRRLAKSIGPVKSSGDGELKVIVPSKTMSLLLRVVPGDENAQVSLRVSSSQVLIQVGAVTVASVLVEGHFPKYEDVIPSDNRTKVMFKTAELLAAVRRAALLTSDESKGIRLEFSSDGLVLSSRAPQQGEATIELPTSYQGEPLAIGFNPGFLVDALRVIQEDEVGLELNDADKPGVLTVGKEFTYVIMPVNLA